jgi:prepilin-type N-terminal cleavage/methylation domain-containing protein
MQIKRKNGFTLIELIIVIVLLAILAVVALAKFNDLTDTAIKAKVKANAAALKTGVQLAHTKWLALGSPTSLAARNDIQIYGDQSTGKIDLNTNGWPAQSWIGSDIRLHTNNDADCLSLWGALISDGTSKAAINNSAEFIVNFEGDETCSYKLTKNPSYGFIYDSKTGQVVLTF